MNKNFLLSVFTVFLISFPLLAQTANTSDHFKKVVWIVFENTDYTKALAQPDFHSLAQNGVLLTKLNAKVHPSQGNYIAMIAGSILGVTSDNNYDLKDTHVGDLLEKNNMKWKVYAENYPGKCFTGKSSGQFVRKHVPFLSFLNVTQNSARCMNIEDETNFFSDYKKDTLPEFSMYIPNIRNDAHDTGVDFGGKWLTKTFGSLLLHPDTLKDVLFIVTFDESGKGQSPDTNQIYTVILGSKIKAGTTNSQSLSHAALLKMIEDEYGIGNLGREDLKAPVIDGIWK